MYRDVDDIVVATMTIAMEDSWMNPSSLYASNVKNKIDKCRENVAKFIGAKADEIYFTSSASESNNWAIRGWIDEVWSNTSKNPFVITTPIEHKSILDLLNNGCWDATVDYCRVDENGLVDYEYLEEILILRYDSQILVSIHMANNEIGSIQDIKKIADLVHRYNGILHVDATQALPYIPIDVKTLGIDLLSASGHKMSSVLRGIGFLYKRNGVNIKPLIYGSQENGMRGSTENTYGIIGLSKALEYCDLSYETIGKLRDKRNYFITILKSKFGCKLNGSENSRLPNNINVVFPQNVEAEALLYMLDMSGIKASVGSACNSKEIEPSHVLTAIGLSKEEAMRSVRFTLPESITYEQINFVIDEISKALKIIESSNGDV